MNKNLETYVDIIYMTKYRSPNYFVINTEKYLERMFPKKKLFEQDFNISQITQLIEEKYGNTKNAFPIYGRLITTELN